jgi:hypothetical protein
MLKKYLYQVDNFTTATREAARMIQRSLRNSGVSPTPRIVQKLTVERIVR